MVLLWWCCFITWDILACKTMRKTMVHHLDWKTMKALSDPRIGHTSWWLHSSWWDLDAAWRKTRGPSTDASVDWKWKDGPPLEGGTGWYPPPDNKELFWGSLTGDPLNYLERWSTPRYKNSRQPKKTTARFLWPPPHPSNNFSKLMRKDTWIHMATHGSSHLFLQCERASVVIKSLTPYKERQPDVSSYIIIWYLWKNLQTQYRYQESTSLSKLFGGWGTPQSTQCPRAPPLYLNYLEGGGTPKAASVLELHLSI